jgi:predicted enzyme related to lactoylglutathione lyase
VGQVTSYPHGTFCWVDLGTPALDAARRFYEALLGWQTEQVETPDPGVYLVARIDGQDVAGLHDHSHGGAHDWDSYIAVDDLDATLDRVGTLDAVVEYGPHDIPGSARMGMITDRGGARVCLWQPLGFAGARLVNETGTWTWSDLSTRAPGAAEAFYRNLFGWSFRELAPGYWGISMDDLLIGGMRAMGEGQSGVTPSWVPYFVVDDADEAAARVQELGGEVLVPPTDVPGGRFLVISDPLGSAAGLSEMGPKGPAGGLDQRQVKSD